MPGDKTIVQKLLLPLNPLIPVISDRRNPKITNVIDTTQIHIISSVNPDGVDTIKNSALK
jgi:hypothetical protein